jgi:GT2 family glycosyltransferase
MRRLDIGVASYRNPERLHNTLLSILTRSQTDWRCFIIHNPSPDDEHTRSIIGGAVQQASGHFVPIWLPENIGYAGAVNQLLERAETEYIAYCDNDVEINTPGWDEQFCQLLDQRHEVGMVFPNGGAWPIDRVAYTEVMWCPGFCWALNRMVPAEIGGFDLTLGHQEEADYCMRVRMGGWKCAALPRVSVTHHATATNDSAATERINRGVVNWVNKWNRYFNGKLFNYYSPNVTRHEDWPPNALYLEEYWLKVWPQLNASPEVAVHEGREYDLIRVPRFKSFYRGRII